MAVLALHSLYGVPLLAEAQERYLLITNELLRDSFQPLVDHRCSQGMEGILIIVEDINNLYAGDDTQEKIRTCIQSYYDPSQTMYLVLGGDELVVRPRYCDAKDGESPHPTDLYYADMDGGSWDLDGNGVYGEPNDVGIVELTPEVCFGRIPVRDPIAAQGYCAKAIRYDLEWDPNEFVDSLLLMKGSKYEYYLTGPARPLGYRDHDPVSEDEVIRTDMFLNIIQPFWQPGRLAKLFATNTDWDTETFGDFHLSDENVFNTLNQDFHYIYFNEHSQKMKWGFNDGTSQVSSLTVEDALELSNELSSIVFAHGCSSGRYDDPSEDETLCEALIRNPDGGPIVMFVHSRGSGGSNHWGQILCNIFQEDHYRIGEAYRSCLAEMAPLDRSALYHQYIFLLLGDPAVACHRQIKKTLQLFSPKGNEIITSGSDLYIRWNAAGLFSPGETVCLEYSKDDGDNWEAIPDANELVYNEALFIWSNCPLENGSQYRIRVSSTQNPELFSESPKPFTIASTGELTIKSSPLYNVLIGGTNPNYSEFICSVIRNDSFRLIAPDIWKIPSSPYDPNHPNRKDVLQFSGWFDANGLLLSDINEYEFEFDHDTTLTALYDYPGEGVDYYINDALAENGIAPGNNDNDGLSPDTPMRSIQMLLDRYPEIGYEDTIHVSDGHFYENLSIDSVYSGVTIVGNGHSSTIIDGGKIAPCVRFDAETICHFEGLGFINGKGDIPGGAIRMGAQCKCTVRDCWFEGNEGHNGGAILLAGSPAVIGLEVYDSTFVHNHATSRGGALFAFGDARAEFHRCTFKENSAGLGGAITTAGTSFSDYVDCVFDKNTSSGAAGGLFTTESSVANLSRSTFTNNAGLKGGGLWVQNESNVSAQHCLFTGNSAVKAGGAVSVHLGGTFNAQNCTITANSSSGGGGVAWYSVNDIALVNCIIAGNPSGSWSDLRLQGTGTAFVSYCCIPAECDGVGNITEVPLFRNEDANDYRLASSSPCIDTGSPDVADFVDLYGNNGPIDGNSDGLRTSDIGAYEFCPIPDLSNDGRVDLKDFAILGQYWQQNAQSADIAPTSGGDGHVDFKDIALMVAYWLEDNNEQ